MNDLMQSVEERSKLAGSNHLEALMFSLGHDSSLNKDLLFGINVFKVKEVMVVPKITPLPNMQNCLSGVVNVRGKSIPVINVPKYCDVTSDEPPKILIITEYNRRIQGLLAHEVESIERIAWADIKPPPLTGSADEQDLITGLYQVESGRSLMLLDVEKVLSDVLGSNGGLVKMEGVERDCLKGVRAFFCDDSAVARGQLQQMLDYMGIVYASEINGVDAWEHLQKLADQAEESGTPVQKILDCVITDIEMPGMDGYVLTKNIKSDPRFEGVPVIMHSSLSSKNNQSLGENVGVDAYVPKLHQTELAATLTELVNSY
ncbi:MAG: chemotaxis protein CheV [Thiothrix sp.]|nr:MAG: chemotaxis protein CheV [Thiothrix sp.]